MVSMDDSIFPIPHGPTSDSDDEDEIDESPLSNGFHGFLKLELPMCWRNGMELATRRKEKM